MLDTRSFNDWQECIPSDTADLSQFLTQPPRLTVALYVGTGGDVALVEQNGSATVWTNVPSGALLPVAIRRVNATGTTASGLVACFAV